MKYINNEKGYTLIELMVILGFMLVTSVLIGGGYSILHFIFKHW